MAIVLVQHLDPSQESILSEILGRHSKLPVLTAEDGMLVEPDHVYVMPAGVTVEVAGGAFKLTARPKEPIRSLPIDTLLRSMAEACGTRSIGAVLSGTGSDGVLGLQSIKEAGGLTFAQDPDSAEYEGMPRASIDAGVVDAVLDPEHLAAELVRVGAHPELGGPNRADAETPGEVDEESLREVLALLREATGLDFSEYRRTSLLRKPVNIAIS
jgi:two-component system CheB/CheR fusion protein